MSDETSRKQAERIFAKAEAMPYPRTDPDKWRANRERAISLIEQALEGSQQMQALAEERDRLQKKVTRLQDRISSAEYQLRGWADDDD